MATYEQGSLVRCDGTFTDTQSGALVDPDVVLFVATKPDRTVIRYTYGTDAELVRLSLGKYEARINADQAGGWGYRFYSTGTGQASGGATFSITADAQV